MTNASFDIPHSQENIYDDQMTKVNGQDIQYRDVGSMAQQSNSSFVLFSAKKLKQRAETWGFVTYTLKR